MGTIWPSIAGNFGPGGKPSVSNIDTFSSYKFLVFTSLLSGLIIWISYKSQLTAKFSVDLKKYPFTDMESLSKTNYL